MQKYLPRDISSFKLMMTEDYLYIDKTQQIYNLYSMKDRYHFLARPRRFGKSLLISTLKEYFSGNQDLFKGLWIDSIGYSWPKHPVIHLDFSAMSNETSQELKINLSWKLELIAQQYNVSIEGAPTPEAKLEALIMKLSEINSVVMLIDEYDYPLVSNLDNLKIAKAHHKVLKNFFSTLKSLNTYMKAIFITGISKFAKESIFSGLNDLNDISEKPLGADLLGYTQKELEFYFMPYIEAMAKKEKCSPKDIMHQMRLWYNGYRFSEQEIRVYNPFSVINYLKDQKLANYWFESGTPSFLVHLFKNQYQSLENLEDTELSVQSLRSFEIENIPLIPLLYQTGYLTFDKYNSTTDKFTLRYPNQEVSDSFKKYLVVALSYTNAITIETLVAQIRKSVDNNDVEGFCTIIKSLFANIPYNLHIGTEGYYHSLIHFMSDLLNLDMESEVSTSRGKIDLVIFAKNRIFVVEFKFKKSAQKALKQIVDKRYYEKYLVKKKAITLIGISFIYKAKKLQLDWIAEELPK